MDEKFGAWQTDSNPVGGAVCFKLFIPGNAPGMNQYERGGDPQIKAVRVIGDFQSTIGLKDWDETTAPAMIATAHPKGTVYSYTSPSLPADFYEYKFLVEFNDGEKRRVGDPCTRYGGEFDQSSGIAVGGSFPALVPLKSPRKPLGELVIYELMIDDFTDEFRGARAPLDAVTDKLDYLKNTLGINAILFMPWTSWDGLAYNWGYAPSQYFSVEYRYANAVDKPEEKLSWLTKLINACHERDLHVIMDGVFNHVDEGSISNGSAYGFPYKFLYKNPADSPYAGPFGGVFGGLQDLDYHNACLQEYIRDVCLYWIDSFGIDGIRFDNTVNYFIEDEPRGLPQLLTDIRNHCTANGIANFSLTLEHLIGYDAASVVNRKGATSCWYNALYGMTFDQLWNGPLPRGLMRALNTQIGFDPDKLATTYLSNHDHSHVAWQAGARMNAGGLQWFRTQPWAIALMTIPGTPMIQNGQEFAEDYWVMEDDQGSNRRVKPRPLRWDFQGDSIGSALSAVYAKLIRIRLGHISLRTANMYPQQEAWETQFNPQGYGADLGRGLVIFHRWGDAGGGKTERVIVVLNFTADAQIVDVPFPTSGVWEDVLNGGSFNVSDFWQRGWKVNSYWGNIFVQTA